MFLKPKKQIYYDLVCPMCSTFIRMKQFVRNLLLFERNERELTSSIWKSKTKTVCISISSRIFHRFQSICSKNRISFRGWDKVLSSSTFFSKANTLFYFKTNKINAQILFPPRNISLANTSNLWYGLDTEKLSKRFRHIHSR